MYSSLMIDNDETSINIIDTYIAKAVGGLPYIVLNSSIESVTKEYFVMIPAGINTTRP